MLKGFSDSPGMMGFGSPRRFVLVLSCMAGSLSLSGCARNGDAKQSEVQATAPAGDDLPSVLATIGEEKVTLDEVRARLGTPLVKLETQFERSRSGMIDSALQTIIAEKIVQSEAQKSGKSAEELLAAEVGGNLEPTEIEVSTWYQDNQLRLGGRALSTIRPQIMDLLRMQKRKDATQKLQARLAEAMKVTVNFEPFRLTLSNEGAPSLGNKNASVTVVEFSDFQCPFCQRFAPTLKRIEQEFGDKVHVVYRQYPIPSLHPNAFKAAEASLCANEQDKFWQLHDLMFAEQDRLDVTNLKEKAKRIGLNQGAFNKCLDSGKYVEQVQRDQQEGLRSGITGTPAVFVNGIELQGGAVGYDVVRSAILRELNRGQKAK